MKTAKILINIMSDILPEIWTEQIPTTSAMY
jgi:hypothetical protein